jgi:hypothetical protein
LPAQQRHEQDVRSRGRLRDRDRGIELRIGEPCAFCDQEAMHVRRGRNCAAYRQKRKKQVLHEKGEPVLPGELQYECLRGVDH